MSFLEPIFFFLFVCACYPKPEELKGLARTRSEVL